MDNKDFLKNREENIFFEQDLQQEQIDLNLNQVFVGEVIDNADPDNLGRVKVRIFNIHDENETETLPWALFLGTGKERVVPEVGDYVAILFLNGQVELPVYLGTLNMKSIGISSTKENQSKADIIFESRDHKAYIKNEQNSLEIVKDSPVSNIIISASNPQESVKLGKTNATVYDKVVVENKLKMLMQTMVTMININFTVLNFHVHPGQMAGPIPVVPTPPSPQAPNILTINQSICSDNVSASVG